MPFKSQAQRDKFYAMADRGEISKATVRHWEAATPKDKKFPEHVAHKKEGAFYEHGVKQAMLDIGLMGKTASLKGFRAALQGKPTEVLEKMLKRVGDTTVKRYGRIAPDAFPRFSPKDKAVNALIDAWYPRVSSHAHTMSMHA